ncbi:MAG: epimerase [Myxococcales bacterium]|nr:epimerase [Myxococcales bacterium]
MLEGKTIMISGGAGFIGTALIARLIDANKVVVLDNLSRNALKDTPYWDHENLTLVEADVRDEDAVRGAMRGATHVIHLASIAGVDTVISRPVETMQVTLLGTIAMLKVAQELGGVERFIDFSTSEVFGRFAYKVTEGDATQLGVVGEARWTYAVSKLATEHLAHNYHRQFGLPTVAIRPFNIFGPGQVGSGAIHPFVVRAIRGEPLHVHNDGSQIRSWCYIDDIIDGVLLSLEREEAVGQSFNIGNPRSTLTIYKLAEEVVRLAGSDSEVLFKEWPYPDVELRIPDIQKARDLLGYEPRVELEEGLLKTIAWYRDRNV